jgi:hypothetical protein
LAATITPSDKRRTFAWSDVGQRSRDYTTPDRNCSKNCNGEPTKGPNHVEVVAAPFYNPPEENTEQVGSVAGFSCVSGAACGGWYDGVRSAVVDGGAKAVADWNTWGSPTIWRLTANLQKWTVTGEKVEDGMPQDVAFSAPVYVDFPVQSTWRVLKVKTFTKREYSMLVGAPDTTTGLMKLLGTEHPSPGVNRIEYQAVLPPGIQ